MEQPVEKPQGDHVLHTPLWIMIIRGFQFLISLIIVGLCGRMIHDAYLDEEGFSLAVSILTWLAVAYVVFTEKIPSLRGAYHILAVLIVDGLLIILWLAAWAATASRRSKYVVPVTVGDCYDDGSVVNSKSCDVVFKRAIHTKRDVILTKIGLAMLSSIAGLGALVWVLFIATFVWTLLMFLRGRKEGRFAVGSSSTGTPTDNYQMENKISEAQPMNAPPQQFQGQPQPQQFQQPAPNGQFAPQQQPQFSPQPTPAPAYQQPPFQQPQSPYQQQGAYPPPQAPYSPQDQQQQQQQQQFQGQPTYGQYPQQQPQQAPYQQPAPQTYGSELDGQNQYTAPPPAVSPPPQQYQQQPYAQQ
ncbi:uncharacterized protein NECHADRAFT_75635 [Fusarium vanettenii 77-13-4]|uniref:MARVEL domain-containing protein n=1 Tax=Fusarium vanettenii (strain ATCC MYA-4622 / CBS 123669 / FGSC 9596 / NRRL 45880 / 77-13-4) TaxID=660122 RepID=C7YJD0_FUSV7|nr:uncharacterized protein NECHADRAFT_75635 [Fusarium vanettenii 77-13-4]EEU48253.1 hypothetical protein NECHADRAFT_75635 [Fusarium vanettenii 77-13-4]